MRKSNVYKARIAKAKTQNYNCLYYKDAVDLSLAELRKKKAMRKLKQKSKTRNRNS